MKILYFYEKESEKHYVHEHMNDHEIEFVQGILQDHPEISGDEYDALSVFVSSTVGPAEMNRFPNLKLIATRSTGFDHIDLNEAKERNIIVSNVPVYGSHSVAEHAVALLLALAKNIHTGYVQVAHDFEFGRENLLGFDLDGKTIGVVGTGNIGKHVIHIARSFNMKGLVFDIYPDETFAKLHETPYVEMDELFAQSDIVSVHVPLNKHTHHMINNETLSKFKDGAYLINTSRGEVVKSRDLYEALESGKIAGAGLDVLEGEKMMHDYEEVLENGTDEEKALVEINKKIIEHPKTIVTPHIASQTKEANERRMDATMENIRGFADGKPINTISTQ